MSLQEQILVISWWCWTTVSYIASSKLKAKHRFCRGAGRGTGGSDDLHGPYSPMEALSTGQGGDSGGITTWDGDCLGWSPTPVVFFSPTFWLLCLPMGSTFLERCQDSERLSGQCSEVEDLPGTSSDIQFENPRPPDYQAHRDAVSL